MNQIEVDFAEDIGKRPYMEDRIIIEPNIYEGLSLFAVCDGHGGSYVCNFLKFHMKDILVEQLKETTDLVLAIRETFKKITAQLNINEAAFQGSTLCAVMIKSNLIISINIGDSRAVMGFKDQAADLTTDHKPADPAEESRIVASGGFVSRNAMDVPRVNGNLAVSRSVGDFYLFPYVISDPDIKAFNLAALEECYIVIATDGIWDVFHGFEVVQLVSSGAKARDLMSLATEKGSMDNMAVLVLHKTVVQKINIE